MPIGIIPTTDFCLDLSCPDVSFHASVEVLAAPRREHFLMYFSNTGKSRGYERVFSSLAYSFKNKVPHPTYCSKWRCLLFLKIYSKKTCPFSCAKSTSRQLPVVILHSFKTSPLPPCCPQSQPTATQAYPSWWPYCFL